MGRKEAEEGAEDQCRGRGVAGRVVDRSRLTPAREVLECWLEKVSFLSSFARPSFLLQEIPLGMGVGRTGGGQEPWKLVQRKEKLRPQDRKSFYLQVLPTHEWWDDPNSK